MKSLRGSLPQSKKSLQFKSFDKNKLRNKSLNIKKDYPVLKNSLKSKQQIRYWFQKPKGVKNNNQ